MAVDDTHMLDLTSAGISSLSSVLEAVDPLGMLNEIDRRTLPRLPMSDVKFAAPVEQQEVWAAGVTYLRSKTARMEESDFSATAYDRVYEAERPEIFFKAVAEKVVAPDEPVGIRRRRALERAGTGARTCPELARCHHWAVLSATT